MERKPLAGRRLLILEDEFIVAQHLAMLVESLGGEVAGPVADLSEAMEMAEQVAIDAAILDIRVGGATSFEFARSLRARRVPVAISTGYDGTALPDGLKDAPLLAKPFSDRGVEEIAAMLFPEGAPSA